MSQGYNKTLSSLLVKTQKPLDIIPLSEYNRISLMERNLIMNNLIFERWRDNG